MTMSLSVGISSSMAPGTSDLYGSKPWEPEVRVVGFMEPYSAIQSESYLYSSGGDFSRCHCPTYFTPSCTFTQRFSSYCTDYDRL